MERNKGHTKDSCPLQMVHSEQESQRASLPLPRTQYLFAGVSHRTEDSCPLQVVQGTTAEDSRPLSSVTHRQTQPHTHCYKVQTIGSGSVPLDHSGPEPTA